MVRKAIIPWCKYLELCTVISTTVTRMLSSAAIAVDRVWKEGCALETFDAWETTERLEHEKGRGDPFAAALRATRMPMIITDPRQDDNPIVFANSAFLSLTGYQRDEIMGRNCRFLQGEGTDRDTVALIKRAIAANPDISIDILNYRKDRDVAPDQPSFITGLSSPCGPIWTGLQTRSV